MIAEELKPLLADNRKLSVIEDYAHESHGKFWSSKLRIRKLIDLSAAQVTSVAHNEIVSSMSRDENADKHNTTVELVGRIVRSVKSDRAFLKRRLKAE